MSARRQRITPRTHEAQVIPMPRAGVVRLDRVAEARRRIAEGWYDRVDVRDNLVEAVMQEIRGY
jgi:hypothetical protein